MKPKKYSSFSIWVLFVVLLSFITATDSYCAAGKPNKMATHLWDRLTAGLTADSIIEFEQKADLSAAYSMDWDARGIYVVETLKRVAQESQAEAIRYLQAKGLRYESYFTSNEIHVWGCNLNTAIDLSNLPHVKSIREAQVIYLDPIITDTIVPEGTTAWGITDAKAVQFWSTFGKKGENIVVANIDSGVQWNHPALVNQFNCPGAPTDSKCWRDPANICGSAGACDNNGHGTHTMGTMVAKDDPSLTYIAGMAPNAKWIACKGCEGSYCTDASLNSCADWILAPGGNTANRPHIVNNSWGGGGGNSWYLGKVNAWRAAGIFPAFSAGNNYTCSSLGSPGDYQESFSTASHTSTRTISSFSSKGPSAFGHSPYTKPNISAPGSSVCSTIPGSSWSCNYSGTSMASPHTAGAVALLWSCSPSLRGQIDQTFQTLQNKADTPPAGNCGAPPDAQGNYTYGYGYLNVLAAGQGICGGEASPIDCSGGAVVLQNVTFLSGNTYNCTATTSITAGTGVTVQSGAAVNFRAPIIDLLPGFHVESGAAFSAKQATESSPIPPPSPPPTCPAIPNGNFESGRTIWTEFSTHGWPLIVTPPDLIVDPHGGSWGVWLGGDYNETSYIQQQVTVSSACPYLVFYHWIASEDICGYDYGTTRINGTVVDTVNHCSSNNTGGWVVKSINLSSYSGQTVTLQIRSVTDGSLNSNWFIDDVSFRASAPTSAPPTMKDKKIQFSNVLKKNLRR
ncbi:MAG: S8 family serine peptidase [Nitrospirota bacterium]